jgi:PAS domain S-box-containing protein
MLTPSALARRAIERGAQLILKDDPNAMHADSRPFGDVSRPSASILYAPIRHNSEVVGLISIQSYRPGAYDEHSRETVQALADHCGGTLARIRAEEELRISGARFLSVWENSIDGMRLTDRVGRIVAVNEAYCRLVKLPREKLEGQLFSVVYEGQGPGEGLEAYQDQFDSGQITPSLATQVRLWNAEVLDLEISSSFIERGAHGKVLLGVFRNATERRRIEAQLRQSQKMEGIGQLAGGLAHDFNNLLAVINGNAELILQEGDSLSAPAREFLGHITGAAERAANLTRQLLIFSRKQAMQTQLVALNDLIGNLTRMLTRLIREDISLECAYAEPLPYVRADPGMIEQVLLNLVVNARDAMAQGGRLDIRTQEVRLEAADLRANSEAREGDFVCLRVADTGPGIPPEILPRIFEPFFSTKGIGKGTGLGLATVLGITQQHRGWVEVASTVGQGTTFSVFLPAVTDAALTPEKRAAESAPRGGTETILLVEDEPAVRMTTRRLLESKGYQVYAVASGQEAIEVWREHPGEIALLLTDIVMPGGVNGWELSERLCAQRPELRVIYLTGYSADVVGADTQLVRRTRSCLLHKPCSANRLLRIVRQCLDAA